jgi:hypothetical protein
LALLFGSTEARKKKTAIATLLCLSEIKLARTDDEVRQEMA